MPVLGHKPKAKPEQILSAFAPESALKQTPLPGIDGRPPPAPDRRRLFDRARAFRQSPDTSVAKFDVETLPRGNRRGVAQRLAFAAAHEGKTARQHAAIGEG